MKFGTYVPTEEESVSFPEPSVGYVDADTLEGFIASLREATAGGESFIVAAFPTVDEPQKVGKRTMIGKAGTGWSGLPTNIVSYDDGGKPQQRVRIQANLMLENLQEEAQTAETETSETETAANANA
jgi:hypothetical protein